MGLEGKSAFAGLLALCAGAIGAGCHGTSTDSGLIRVAVQAQTTSAQITRVSCAVTPAGVSADLPRTAADTFGGTLTVAVGTQTVRADAFAGSTAVGSGTASVTVTKGAKSQVFITILDSTGPAPQPDHAPVVTSLSVPASTAKVGDQLALAATAMDADGDPIAFSWSVSPAGCGTFSAPAAASTAWTAAAPGDCAVTVTATAKGKSDSKSATITVAATTPGKPTITSATPGNGQVSLAWSAPASTGGSAITGYTATSSPGGFFAKVSGTTLTATVTGLANGTAYTFTVFATNAAGDGPSSSPSASVTPFTLPGAPTAVSGAPGNAQVTVSWTAPASDGGSAITGYTATSSPGGLTGQSIGSATSAIVSGLTNGTAYTFAVYATNAAGNGPASQASAAVTPTASALPAFPLRVSANRRYLEDQNGKPFPILGDTSWEAPHNLSLAELGVLFDDRARRGFNVTVSEAIEHKFSTSAPRNNNGDLPFLSTLGGSSWNGSLSYSNPSLQAPDFTTPNEAYWAFFDSYVSLAEQKGVAIFLFHAYCGYAGGAEGWMVEMTANDGTSAGSHTKAFLYGAWIANRYRDRKNIVWVDGGDYGTAPLTFTTAQENAVNSMLQGLKSVAGAQSVLHTGHWNSPSVVTDQARFGPLLDLQSAYSFTGDMSIVRTGYAHSPVNPTFLIEEPYESGADGITSAPNPASTEPIRRFLWWGWLGSIGGYLWANNYLWLFPPNWQTYLDTRGARDMSVLNQFINSIPWHTLVPSGLGGQKLLVVTNGSTPGAADYVAAAASLDGRWFVAYVPPAWSSGTFQIDATAMRASYRARWLNPFSGVYADINPSLPNTGKQTFTPPPASANGSGFGDWTLVLDAP